MAGQTRRPKTDLPAYTAALRAAHEERQDEHGNFAPQPLCLDNPGPWTDYTSPKEKLREAEALCAPCPLREICLKNAKHRQPGWTVQGGVVWVGGRQAHLLQNGDPRLEDPDADELDTTST